MVQQRAQLKGLRGGFEVPVTMMMMTVNILMTTVMINITQECCQQGSSGYYVNI